MLHEQGESEVTASAARATFCPDRVPAK